MMMMTTGVSLNVCKWHCEAVEITRGVKHDPFVCQLLIYLVHGQGHVVRMGLVAGSRGRACESAAIAMQLSEETKEEMERRKERLR